MSVNLPLTDVKYAAFSYVISDGMLCLGKRGTNPHMHFWGPIGGKNDPGKSVSSINHVVTKPGGSLHMSRVDSRLVSKGFEPLYQTALREAGEELFNKKGADPQYLCSIFKYAHRLGHIVDTLADGTNHACYFYLTELKPGVSLQLSPRELFDFKPLDELIKEGIIFDDLFPIAKPSLIAISELFAKGDHLRTDYLKHLPDLSQQIELMNPECVYDTSRMNFPVLFERVFHDSSSTRL